MKWAPHATRKMFRESESVNIFFDTAKDGIKWKGDKPIGLLNRGIGGNVELVQNFPKMTKIKATGKWMMELNNSLFKIGPIETATASPSIAIFGLSFKSLSISKEPRFLFSNESLTRAVSIEDKKIGEEYVGILHIHGNEGSYPTELTFNRKVWSTLLIQYSCIGDKTEGRFIFNRKNGSFHPGHVSKETDSKLYIGGHPTKTREHHAMASFEMYQTPLDEEKDYILSQQMCDCLLDDIEQRVEDVVSV